MALTIYNIKRWFLMLRGKSLFHVNQEEGKYYSTTTVAGYYNDLTEKVVRQPELLESDNLPLHPTATKEQVYFPVAIFQYGLGAYDLYLGTKDERYLKKFMQCVEWTLANQEPSGAWNNFFFSYPDHPYGAMAQGEGASILLRGYAFTKDTRYLQAAKKAIDFMLIPVDEGGTADGAIFLEYTHLQAVMNGWIFAWWGLYDYVLTTQDDGQYKDILDKSCSELEKRLPSFSNSYWSMYDLAGRVASHFYHHLHIAQMQAMYQLTGHDIFREYARKWKANEENTLSKTRAFVKKAWQKVVE